MMMFAGVLIGTLVGMSVFNVVFLSLICHGDQCPSVNRVLTDLDLTRLN